jgi:RNA polymerase sigma-70 factor, ECF subfamily
VETIERQIRFEHMFRDHVDAIRRYSRSRLASLDEAEDVTQQTFLVAFRKLDELKDDHALPWLYGIARRTTLSHRRAQERQQRISMKMRLERVAPVQDAAALPLVFRALASLRELEQEVLLLHAVDGLSSSEAAAVLDCSPAAYRVRLHRARRKLRSRLTELEPELSVDSLLTREAFSW